jgi:lambda repressor-like predicted transcriptional regulator
MSSIRGLSTIDRSTLRSLEPEDIQPTLPQQPIARTPAFENSSFDANAVSGPKGPPPFLDAAASALGLSSEDLSAKLQSGESLEAVAQEQGVSTDSVTQAIADDFKANNPDATDDQASAVAQRALEGPKAHHHHGGKPRDLDDLAQKLGLSTDDLKTQLQNGSSLADIATAQGLSLDSIAPQPFRIADLQSKQLAP